MNVRAVAAFVAFVILATRAQAAQKITFLYSAGDSFTPAYVAKDRGFFERHGLDVDPIASQNGSVMSAALVGGSAQIAAPTPTVLLQGDEQGLDLVIIASANYNPNQPAEREQGIVARTDSGIKGAADLAGKKFAVPGLGGTIDVLAKKWVMSRGLDYRKVQWVEMQFPNMSDALKSGLADAASVVNPFYQRILANKVGYDLGDFNAITPPGNMVVVYATTREWATENRETVDAFRASLGDAVAFVRDPANAAAVKESIARWTKLPPQAAANIEIPVNLDPVAKPSGMKFWIDACRELGLIKGNPDPASFIAP